MQWRQLDEKLFNVCSKEKYTKRSSVPLMCLVYFSAEQTLAVAGMKIFPNSMLSTKRTHFQWLSLYHFLIKVDKKLASWVSSTPQT